ncbi:GH1 family beta-glucosidase [Pelomonas sp. KK5]|uniref:GH1 family beta-glucosidase n=1 Tax=Pelomonas sp. KK5 TaxID=1855730 RepID=UPI0009F97364|nr:GH1 family beta-glucosidase [Pelomonas sp. KK5]
MSTLRLQPPAALATPDFLWGVATASFQIEGAWATDGRLPCIWGTFCNTPGKILNNDTGEFACDHYHRWAEDVDLMAHLGVDAYRLSTAWGRVMDEKGNPNHKGLDFYKRLLDRLQEKGIQPWVTLYHWDLPQHLEDRGGWLNRDTAYRFAEYADLMSRELKGRVAGWMTLNEPWCSAFLGYGNGHHAPGKANIAYVRPAMHHLLLGHGLALPALKANDPNAKRGIVANVGRGTSDSQAPEDQDAAMLYEVQHNNWVLDPLLKGTYPKALERLWPESRPLVLEGDMETISQPIDFLGINYYFRMNLHSDGAHGFKDVPLKDVERTQMGWEVHPQGLEHLLVSFKAQYGDKLPPIYITENGMASDDAVGPDGQVHDEQRISFLNRHLQAVANAKQHGVDVKGYFCWSLMDNFEWAFGYERRFGLVHVDYTTQKRTPKDSALQLREFLAARA